MKITLPKKDQKIIIKQVNKQAEKEIEQAKKQKTCIICGKEATHQVKNQPTMCYCKECGKEQFKYLNYLERL